MGGPNDRDFYADANGNLTNQSVRDAIERMGSGQRPTDCPDDMHFLSNEQRDLLREHVRNSPF